MITQKDFDVVKFEIDISKEPATVFPLGDIHFESPNHAAKEFNEVLEVIKRTPNAYIIGLGDWMDLCSTKERRGIVNAQLHDSTESTLDRGHKKDCDILIEKIKATGAKVLAMIQGNHNWRFSSGITTTQYFCENLDAYYLGEGSAIVGFCFYVRKGTKFVKDIAIHHGKGAGKRAGAPLNSLEDFMNSFLTDIVLMGHDHKSAYTTKPICFVDWSKSTCIKQKERHLVRTGSFLKGYVQGERSYVAKRGLAPACVGSSKLIFKYSRKQIKGVDRSEVKIYQREATDE